MGEKALSIWIGLDPRPEELAAYNVARFSMNERMTQPIPVRPVSLPRLREQQLYTRQHEKRINPHGREQLWDTISEYWMATEFAISRFLTPILTQRKGWALFTDSDMLARGNMVRLFDLADESKALMCVQHDHAPKAGATKMDGQVQAAYGRKNWSSVMLFNCEHPANEQLTVELINSLPGRDLHRFCWLDDAEIGALPPAWNYLVGETRGVDDPQLVHFTNGLPNMPGHEDCEYADEWRAALERQAR